MARSHAHTHLNDTSLELELLLLASDAHGVSTRPDPQTGMDTSRPELQQRVHHVMRRGRRLLYGLFAFYSSIDGKLSSMTTRGFFALMNKSNVADGPVTPSELGKVFRAADFEEGREEGGGPLKSTRNVALDDRVLNMINDDNALMRFEFLRNRRRSPTADVTVGQA